MDRFEKLNLYRAWLNIRLEMATIPLVPFGNWSKDIAPLARRGFLIRPSRHAVRSDAISAAMRAAVLAIALLASGCVSQQEQDARYATRCDHLGFKRSTEAFSNCLMKQESDWKRDQNAWMARSKASLESDD